jgi:diguanylate cyclase
VLALLVLLLGLAVLLLLLRLRQQQRQIKKHDRLTGALAREALEHQLERLVAHCDAREQTLCVLAVGLDGLRGVNEGHGHAAGDEVLRQAAARLMGLADRRRVARVAGDEFVLLAMVSLSEARSVAARVVQVLAEPFFVGEQRVALGASVGTAAYPVHGARKRLLSNAALAMREAKRSGGGAFVEFHPSMGVTQREQNALRHDLRMAVERGELELVYQPKIDARSLQVTAAEALLRWNHPKRGVISPTVFIPVAERDGSIRSIGHWVIEEACRQAALWREKGLRMRVAVNLSGAQIREDQLVDRIEEALKRHKLVAARFTCEITESVAMEDTAATTRTFERLRQAGLHMSIDDFGTGYSSLASLRRLPAAELKIDRAFVSDLDGNAGEQANAHAIASAIVQMAHSLDLRVVAEGVETVAQRDALVKMGCDELQGFLFAKPMSAHNLGLWAGDERKDKTGKFFRPSLFEETGPGKLGS